MSSALAVLPFVVSVALPGPAVAQETSERAADCAALLAALAFVQAEREECLALALSTAMTGDCEGGLAWLDAAAPGDDELGRRIATERRRLAAWIELRDAFLAELAASGKPLALVLDGKRVSTPITREGDELVLARAAGKRLSVRALAPEQLVPSIPKERLGGPAEWLEIYPYCVRANPKWKRLKTSDPSAAELRRDAEEFYPRLAALAPVVQAIEALAGRAPPADAGGARAVLAEIESLLALGRESPCVRARLPALSALAVHLLAQASAGLEAADLVRGAVSSPSVGVLRLVYDFAGEEQGEDWRRDDDYLAGLRAQLDPVSAQDESTAFRPGEGGFSGNGEACWRHALEFHAPLRVRYRVRWEPYEGRPGKVFAFALGMLADREERHLRAHELGFLYVDEQDGPYTAVRPKGDATVDLGRTYVIELVHDGREIEVRVDDVLRAKAAAPRRLEGKLFLWVHSDLRISVPSIEIEGRVTEASLDALRAEWSGAELAGLGLEPPR